MDCDIAACRLCGVFFMQNSLLKNIFENDAGTLEIRSELEAWNIQIKQDDGLPQSICSSCVFEFQRIFKFRHSCQQIQEQLQYFQQIKQTNLLSIKTEPVHYDDGIDFIYVDDLSDYEANEADSSAALQAINNMNIKEEVIEAATVPNIENLCNTAATEQTEQRVDAQNPALIANNASIPCNLCSHFSVSEQAHRLHQRRIHQLSNLHCHICGKEFKNSTKARLNFHLKWHRIYRHQKCAQCSYYCDTKEMLQEHQKKIHGRSRCEVCNKKIQNSKMSLHMRVHDDSFPCGYCQQVFPTENAKQEHISFCHTATDVDSDEEVQEIPGSSYILCAFCEAQFVDVHELRNHVQQYHAHIKKEPISNEEPLVKDEPASCSEAEDDDKSEVEKYDNTVTLKTEHSSINENDLNTKLALDETQTAINTDDDDSDVEISCEQFICAKCSVAFGTLAELVQHSKSHELTNTTCYSTTSEETNEKSKFKCHLCSKQFDLKFSLNRHLKRHV